ncbi:MAG TPA: hypothetical protein VNL13_09625 [Sulfolobales archaeon]|nr:hypothetical protein [Sulfolobales archaeon]
MLSLLNTTTPGKGYLAISKGSVETRRKAAIHILSRTDNAEILCEDPLVIRLKARDYSEARSLVDGLDGGVIIARESEELVRELCNAEKSSQHTEILTPLVNQIRLKSRRILSELVRTIPLIAPSAVSTAGRIVNDMNMIIAGSIASGGVLIMNLYSSRKRHNPGKISKGGV